MIIILYYNNILFFCLQITVKKHTMVCKACNSHVHSVQNYLYHFCCKTVTTVHNNNSCKTITSVHNNKKCKFDM